MSLLYRASFGIMHNSNCKYSIITSTYVKSYILKRRSYLISHMWKSTKHTNDVNLEESSAKENKEYSRSQCVPFDKMVENRRDEAQRTILVQVHSQQSHAELHTYCSQFGEVKGLHHYSLPEPLHFILVEFQNKNDVKNILEVCNHVNKNHVVPVRSTLLWFRAKDKSKSIKLTTQQSKNALPLLVQNGNTAPTQSEIKDMLQSAETFSDQMLILHNATKLSDVGVRLRFLTARQIELALSGLFPLAKALPFGSSVNGFGKVGCDLDLVLQLDEETIKEDDECRLVFHAKTSMPNGRTQVQRHMEMVGDICQLFLPGCSQVRRILQARVPIVKYKQDLMDVECDVSMTNMCAVYMSELLYLLGGIDERVRPLVFAVRCWAREVGLTNPTPGRWITNFSLSLLVLFFLQHRKILPSLNTMTTFARSEDKRVTSDGVNCTFLRDISTLRQLTTFQANSENLETLLFNFFEFYASFDFDTRAVSLTDGVSILKPEHSPLYIVNPLERTLNVSKNVSLEETERFKVELRNAAWNLESGADIEVSKTQAWGLMSLFETASAASKGRNIFFSPPRNLNPRLMDVRELFDKDTDSATTDSDSETTQRVRSSVNKQKSVIKSKRSKESGNTLLAMQKGLEPKLKTKRSLKSNGRRRR